jgi:transcription elongation factor GreA
MKLILNSPESYSYLNFKINDLVLRVLRILKPVNKIESKGNKLKNQAQGILIEKGNAQDVLKQAIESGDDEYARKLYALYKEIPYISDAEKERMIEIISEINTNVQWEDTSLEEEDEDDIVSKIPPNHFLVTRKAISQKKAELEHMINVEMAENSRDIGEAQEKGDLRENAEYKAAMEKQTQIQAAIKRLDQELKNALVLEDYVSNFKADKIGVGCTVKLKSEDSGETISYSILGTWDADTSKNIISYLAPLAKTLIGKAVGDTASLNLSSQESIYTVLEITRFTSVER